jgi:hypothetical protein
MSGAASPFIFNNIIRNNCLDLDSEAGGVMIRGNTNSTIDNNLIYNNPGGGIAARDMNEKPIFITGNHIYGNGTSGLRMQEGAYAILSGENKIFDHSGGAGAIRLQGSVIINIGSLGDQSGLENYQIKLENTACGTDDCYKGMALVTPDNDRSWATIDDYDGTGKTAYLSHSYHIHPAGGEQYTVMQRTRLVMMDGNEIYKCEGFDPEGTINPGAIQLKNGAMLEMDGTVNPNLIHDNVSRAVAGANNVLVNIHGGNRIYGNPEFGLAMGNRNGDANSHSYITIKGNLIYDNCIGGEEVFRQAIGISPWVKNSKITLSIVNNKIYNNSDGGGIAIASLASAGAGEGPGYVDGIIENNEIYGKRIGTGIFLGENAGVLVVKNTVYNNKYGLNVWNTATEEDVESGTLPDQAGFPNNQVSLANTASTVDGYYVGMALDTPGADPGWVRIYDYNGPGRTAYVTPAYSAVRPAAGENYTVINMRYNSRIGDGTDEGRNFIHDNAAVGLAIHASSPIVDNNEI